MSRKLLLISLIFVIVVVAVSITVVSVSGSGGGDVTINQRIAGSIFSWIEVTDPATFETKNYTMLNLIAKGSPGKAQIEVVGTTVPAAAPSGLCPASTGLELVFAEGGIVETFNDHSMLFYVIDGSENAANALCVNFQGGPNTAIFDYVITGGAGRFEGATGSARVEVTAWSVTSTLSGETGTISGVVDLP